LNLNAYFIILLSFILSTTCLSAQMPREKMGSTEAKFFSTETKNSEEVIKLGNQLLSQTNSPEKKSRILGLMAVAYFEKADLNKSTELFFESKNEAEKTGDPEIIAKAYGSLAHQF